MRFAVIPRGSTLAYSADLDNDGEPEWVLENQRARAVFSSRDGGRWLEFVWKDSNFNVLPEGGALAAVGTADVQGNLDGSLEFRAGNLRRTVRLAPSGATLTIEQTSPLAPETLHTARKGNIVFRAERESPTRASYSLDRASE
jgi:hypothetical protein